MKAYVLEWLACNAFCSGTYTMQSRLGQAEQLIAVAALPVLCYDKSFASVILFIDTRPSMPHEDCDWAKQHDQLLRSGRQLICLTLALYLKLVVHLPSVYRCLFVACKHAWHRQQSCKTHHNF